MSSDEQMVRCVHHFAETLLQRMPQKAISNDEGLSDVSYTLAGSARRPGVVSRLRDVLASCLAAVIPVCMVRPSVTDRMLMRGASDAPPPSPYERRYGLDLCRRILDRPQG